MSRSAEYITAFLDLLGTRTQVRDGSFGDTDVLDFVNPVGVAAARLPGVYCAAFSDSVVIAAPVEKVRDFLIALAFVHRQWFADGLLVRGGVATGSFVWTHRDDLDDLLFGSATNFRYARVYGTSFVAAQELESRAGPGALCTLSCSARNTLAAMLPASILDGPASYLVWSDPRSVGWHASYFRHLSRDAAVDSDHWRHAVATRWYFDTLHARRQSLPVNFVPFLPDVPGWLDIDDASG